MPLPNIANVNPGDAILASEHNIIADNVNQLGTGYTLVETVYFTASGTFTKASYPYLRAIRVKCQGAGGGSGGTASTSSIERAFSGHGGGGGYSEKFITDIAGLSSSETVTVGAGGAAGSAGANAGGTGGTSSAFGVSATGGTGGAGAAAVSGAAVLRVGGISGSGSGGDFNLSGGDADHRYAGTAPLAGHLSGNSFLGFSTASSSVAGNAEGSAKNYGGGACGINSTTSQSAKVGVAGAPGIVIVELYA